LQNLSELQCHHNRCDGELNGLTNVYRICLVVIKPLLTLKIAFSSLPKHEQFRALIEEILNGCMDLNQSTRWDSTKLRQQLELMRVVLHSHQLSD